MTHLAPTTSASRPANASESVQARPNLEALVQPIGGLMSQVAPLSALPGEPSFPVFGSMLGDISQVLGRYSRVSDGDTSAYNGAGGSIDPDMARIRAIAEGLERYSSCVFDERQFVWATGNELGREALDLDTIPRCSTSELAHPRCPIAAPSKRAPIRWVRGVSLLDGRPAWVPAVMVFMKLAPLSAAERITLQISTGCAAHISLEHALLSGLSEVIERDAISLVWLQQLPLPRIELDDVPEWLRAYLDRDARQSGGIETTFFDATTDLDVPTVYGVQRSPRNRTLATLVMCSTELNPAHAIAKIVRESASSRFAMQQPRTIPTTWDDYSDVSHGATFMGRPEQSAAFDFLLNSTARRRLSDIPSIGTGDVRRDLAGLLGRLRALGMAAYAVDLTTDEALRTGMSVVRVIVPSLQPLSISFRARFLAHPRLYDAPRRMGYPARGEAGINPLPQPFA